MSYVGFWGLTFQYALETAVAGDHVTSVDMVNCTFNSHGGAAVSVRVRG